MKKIILIINLLLLGTMLLAPAALADDAVAEGPAITERTEALSSNGVQAIAPEEGVNRINSALLKLYKAGVSVVPNIALIALLVGVVIAMLAAALNLENVLKMSLLGMAVVLIAVVVAYAGPFLTAMAKGFGEGL